MLHIQVGFAVDTPSRSTSCPTYLYTYTQSPCITMRIIMEMTFINLINNGRPANDKEECFCLCSFSSSASASDRLLLSSAYIFLFIYTLIASK